MWITNTATTAMMTPIMEAVLKQLDEELEIERKTDDKQGENTQVIAEVNESTATDILEVSNFEVKSTDTELIEMSSAIKDPERNNSLNSTR